MKSRNSFRLVPAVILGTAVLSLVTGQTAERTTFDSDREEERILSVEDYREPWITGDSNGDGAVDYALRLDDRGRKEREAVDHNNDGMMDNFYYYQNGVLSRQEIDTNYDSNIDLWIYMYDGARVDRYERDTNHDGTIDLVRTFGES